MLYYQRFSLAKVTNAGSNDIIAFLPSWSQEAITAWLKSLLLEPLDCLETVYPDDDQHWVLVKKIGNKLSVF